MFFGSSTASPVKQTPNGNLYEIPPERAAEGDHVVLGMLLGDDSLEEIMYNGSTQPLMVFHREFGMCTVSVTLDERYAAFFIGEIARASGRVLDATQPIFDGALADGSRINATVPPVSKHGVSITIRKFKKTRITVADMIRTGTITPEAAAFVWCCLDGFGRRSVNMLVVGGTGSGKTTTLTALAMLIPMNQRLVIIEDTPELVLGHPNLVSLVTSAHANMDYLLRSALRMRPDRIIVGEVRGPEAQTLFTAMNTGHRGCAGTLHANSARECLNRVTSEPMAVPLSQTIGLDMVLVQERRYLNGKPQRVVTEIAELAGFGSTSARINQLYAFESQRNQLLSTGIPSRLRTTICAEAGVTPPHFNATVQRRAQLLSQLAASQASPEQFVAAIQAESRGS
jgi:archaeal flagellar protein FlaI